VLQDAALFHEVRVNRSVCSRSGALALILAAATAPAACADADAPLAALAAPTPMTSPAPATSGEPNLAVGRDGRILLNWTETHEGRHALRFAELVDGAWSAPRTVATGDDWFVNWADFPSLIELPDGTLAAHWLRRSPGGRYAYDVVIAHSRDGGTSWSEPIMPHDDGTFTEHGFVSLFPHNGVLGAVWLDGRNFASVDTTEGGSHGGHADMTLRFASIHADGSVRDGTLLDARICECCQTSAAITENGPIVAYRGRSHDEVRDIQIVRWTANGWSGPAVAHHDGWRIPGCPVNGPMLAADGSRVALAWFTAADETPHVLIAFSDDAGRSFGPPTRVDDGDPLGRVATLLLDDGSALVSWLERTETAAEIRVRRVAADGRRSDATAVAETGHERASGFPRMTRSGERIVFAWTVPGSPRQVLVATTNTPR
jgi:hypothetical protein